MRSPMAGWRFLTTRPVGSTGQDAGSMSVPAHRSSACTRSLNARRSRRSQCGRQPTPRCGPKAWQRWAWRPTSMRGPHSTALQSSRPRARGRVSRSGGGPGSRVSLRRSLAAMRWWRRGQGPRHARTAGCSRCAASNRYADSTRPRTTMNDDASRDSADRAAALDIGRSYIVQAPAGSGKTELLIQRYLALLARVERPEAIVAMTFTRKAAGEIRERIITALREAEAPLRSEPSRERTLQLARAVLQRDAALGWDL